MNVGKDCQEWDLEEWDGVGLEENNESVGKECGME